MTEKEQLFMEELKILLKKYDVTIHYKSYPVGNTIINDCAISGKDIMIYMNDIADDLKN